MREEIFLSSADDLQRKEEDDTMVQGRVIDKAADISRRVLEKEVIQAVECLKKLTRDSSKL